MNFGPARWLTATPQFHHWRHAREPRAYNTNYAGEFPILDALFGTLYLPAGRRSTASTNPSRPGISVSLRGRCGPDARRTLKRHAHRQPDTGSRLRSEPERPLRIYVGWRGLHDGV